MQKKACLCLLIIAPIALGQANTTNIQVTRNPDWTWLKHLIENEEALVTHRLPIRNAFPGWVNFSNWMENGPDRCLCCPSQTDNFYCWNKLLEPIRQRNRNPVTT